MRTEDRRLTALNGICPYFTMFPLDFPLTVLREHAQVGDWVLDPFCGRGTTNYASRLLGLPSIGIDSSPIAVALAEAKLANATAQEVVDAARRLLEEVAEPRDLPHGEFWMWAFHADVLGIICRLREGLIRDCQTDGRKALRALLMGALHGPRPKSKQAYFSNQSQRTYAPKPRYAVKFWKQRNLSPERVDVLRIVEERAARYFGHENRRAVGWVIHGDSTKPETFAGLEQQGFRWIITSPPYYGMRTYISDQWLRSWFLGGPPQVDYRADRQLEHSSPEVFAIQLRQVWRHVCSISTSDARLVIRYGAISDRKADPEQILKLSLDDSGWQIDSSVPAGTAAQGRRQALHFAHRPGHAIQEHDIWAIRTEAG